MAVNFIPEFLRPRFQFGGFGGDPGPGGGLVGSPFGGQRPIPGLGVPISGAPTGFAPAQGTAVPQTGAYASPQSSSGGGNDGFSTLQWLGLGAMGAGAIGDLYGAYKQGQAMDRQSRLAGREYEDRRKDRAEEQERRRAGSQMLAAYLAAMQNKRGG